ncbi:hypothetical protein ABAC402_08950 [Asticcacaulis sp. AC402]|nr:hypothetical protein ABAC402_08950 [Asticcacaulis sp. AC402]
MTWLKAWHPDTAWQLLPLLVRKGTKKERPFMVLDGRRRLLGFRSLQEQGLITEDLVISAELCETQEAIAAAPVTADGARLPVGPADKILAIRAMAEKKFSDDKIARGLCMDLVEVKKFHVVSRAHLDAIMAFKTKFIDFNTLKWSPVFQRSPSRKPSSNRAGSTVTSVHARFVIILIRKACRSPRR